jgi:peptide/nickel transport system permease protein
MGKFIIKRVLISIVVVFLVSVFAFSLMHILPGDPARLSLGEEASQEDVDALREELNLNKPVLEQYFIWISGIFRGDFGQSIQYHRPVLDIMQERLPRTVAIGLPTLVISTIIGIAFGIISAIRRGKFIDQVITFLATIGMGTPVFWIGILGIYLFAMRLGILPIQGFTSPTEDFAKYVHQAILPVFCLSTHQVASVSRQTRTNMLDVINQDYIRTAKANGIRPSSIVFKHALRNALIPIVTVIAMQVRMVIGGSLIVEQVFNIAGIGQLLQTAVGNRDYLIVQGAVLVISLVTVGCNLLVDILYGVVDPRIRKTQR